MLCGLLYVQRACGRAGRKNAFQGIGVKALHCGYEVFSFSRIVIDASLALRLFLNLWLCLLVKTFFVFDFESTSVTALGGFRLILVCNLTEVDNSRACTFLQPSFAVHRDPRVLAVLVVLFWSCSHWHLYIHRTCFAS